ncbi:hypothetical protein [Cerasicoccus frondis]|uniref:hypothetical protein n=1 Tax=Cerasicoccus frondis TaxID=490090 RepID=UPI002852978C|nr:hypothetical protein [Cerasicoccus frondis]
MKNIIPTHVLSASWVALLFLYIASSCRLWAADAPSPDTIDYQGITLDSSSLTFTDTGDGVTFSATGEVTLMFADEELDVALETEDGEDGIVIDGDANIVFLEAQVTTDFEILGASFTADEDNPLTFVYDSDNGQYLLWGGAELAVNDGDAEDPLTVTIGTGADDPGLVIDASGITLFSFGLMDDLNYDGVTISIGDDDTALTFVYNADDLVFETYGGVTISYEETGTTFTAALGDADAPGLVLSSNANSQLVLEALNATLTGSFDIDALSFEISDDDPLAIVYTAETDYYEINGMVTVSIEENMVAATFGYDVVDDGDETTSYPGMQIQDGDLIGVDFIITEAFSIAGVTMETTEDGIGFSHSGISDYYYAFGGLQISFGDQDVAFSAGSYIRPGITLSADATTNGLELEFLLISLSGNLNFYGVEFVPEDITFSFTKSDGTYANLFVFYGDVTVGVEGNDVSAFLGTEDNPGFAFAGGELLNLDVGINDSITLAGLTVATTGDYLGVSYNESSEMFDVFGGLSVTFEDQTMSITAGTSDEPGLQLVGNDSNHFELVALDATVSAGFSLYGLEVDLGDDGVTFIYNSNDDLYEVYGDVDISIEDETVDAFLGDEDTPGFAIQSGTVESVDIGIATEISLGGFKFSSPEDNPLTITYTADNTTYTVYGEAELDTLWDVIVTLGDADNPGIEIIDNRWNIDDLSIEVDRIDLGFAQVKEVAVAYSRDDSDDIEVDITLDVIIPELKGEVDTTVTTENGKISSIYLQYTATGSSEGIEVLDTGVDVAALGVYLQNLDQPAALQVSGDIGLEFGGQLSIGGVTATLGYMEGDVYIDRHMLKLTDSVYYGAYQDDDDWKALIFEGDGELLIDWSNNVYSINSDLYLPTDYGIKITDELLITKAYIVLQADGEVRVPDGIPLIGGQDLGDIGFDLLIDMEDSSQSFAAAWVDINLVVTSEEAGIKYTFKNGDFSFIGSGDIKDLNNTITDVEETVEKDEITYSQKTYRYDYTGESSVIAEMSWYLDDGSGTKKDISEMRVSMTGTVRDEISHETSENQPLTMSVLEFTGGSVKTVGDLDSGSLEIIFDNSMGGKVSSEGIISVSPISNETIIDELFPGEVVITYYYPSSLDLGATVVIEQPTIINYSNYSAPTIDFWSIEDDDNVTSSVWIGDTSVSCYDAWQEDLANGGGDSLFDYTYSAYQSSSCVTTDSTDSVLHAGQLLDFSIAATCTDAYASEATITIYADSDNSGHDGTPILTNIAYNSGGDYTYLGITEKLFTPQWTVENVTGVQDGTVYFYAAINNDHQKIAYTDYSDAFTIESPVYGIVYDTDTTNPLSGFRVFWDVDGDLQYDADVDESATTDENGNYVFDGVPAGEVIIGVIIPEGYASNDEGENLVRTTYLTGESVIADFNVNLLDCISGVVFADINGDGYLDEDEVGIQGVTLFLDLDGDGAYTKGTDVETITDGLGFWRFYDVEIEATYSIYILAYPSQLTNNDTNYIIVETTTDTVPVEEADEAESLSVKNARSSLVALTSTTKYTEFSDNNIGVYPDAVSEVSDQKFMRYILSYFPVDTNSLSNTNLDPDGDGLNNKIEQLLNTDPTTPNGSPTPIITVGKSSAPEVEDVVLIEFTQASGNKYKVQASSDLKTWETIDTFRALTTEPVILEIYTEQGVASNFFRIVVE